MSGQRTMNLAITLTLLMLVMPWAAAGSSVWIGPTSIASSGQDRVVDGWNVPSNATILDSWMTVDDKMVEDGNGSGWRVDTPSNFSIGQFSDTTMVHFDGRLSLEPDAAVSQVDSFTDVNSIGFNAQLNESGNTSIWAPGLPASVNGTQVGSTLYLPHGEIPANAHGGSIVAATMLGSPVPSGESAGLEMLPFGIPSPVLHFNLTIWNSRHTGADDALWVEYQLDNDPWAWLEPVGGYNSNVTLNATATPAGTPNNGTTFPVWADTTSTGWVENVFNLDNLTGVQNATNINFRFQIVTDANSPGRPGWILDDMLIDNVGGASGYWHHGCYVTTGTCAYNNNADGILQGQVDLTNANAGSEIHVMLEWDLEGSSYDNFCVELSSNNNTWVDISSTTTSTTGSCSGRSGSIPGSGTTVGGSTYGDETGGWIVLEMTVPSAYQNSGMTDIRFRVDTDSSVTYGGTPDDQEGLTLDRISVHDGNNAVVDIDSLSNSNSMWHFGLANALDDWAYINIGAGSTTGGYGFEDSPASSASGMPTGWRSNGDWDFGQLATTNSGPVSWPSGPFGLGTNLAGYADDNTVDNLYSPPYVIPAGASARLTFNSWMCADNGNAGGAVFISTDNNTWSHFNPSSTWYDTTAYNWRVGGSLAGYGIFDGSNAIPTGGWSCNGPHDLWDAHVADISAYSGQTVWFRFTYEPYQWCCMEGWYLDDIGLEVDYFLGRGEWTSDLVQLDQMGGGFIDVDGLIPDSTWATGSLLDSVGNGINGFDNLSFPISLHGLDKDVHPEIKVQVNLGTDDPFLTPLIDAVHVGTVRTLDARGAGNGWDIAPNLDLWDGNLTNNVSAIQTIVGEFVHSSRPIMAVDFAGVGSQVTIRAIDSQGNSIGQSGLTGTITFAEPQPGFGVRIEVNPGGHISSLWAEGVFGQPAVDPTVDATSDGTVDWAFLTGPAFGHHGWQQYLRSANDNSGLTPLDGQTSTVLNIGASGGAVSVFIPGGANVTSATLTLDVTGVAGTTVGLSVGASSVTSLGTGMTTVALSTVEIAHISMVPASSGFQTDRDWRTVEFNLSTTGVASVDVRAITIGYSLSENITGLTDQFIAYHANVIAAGAGSSVDIPLTFHADAGAVVVDGGIYHELMVTNHPFTAPTTMYPDGSVVEIITRHHHLTDNDELSKIALAAQASDGTLIVFELIDPTGSATFNQIDGQVLLPMEADCSVSEVNGVMEVHWRFKLTWIWDDVNSIVWTARGYDSSGDAIAPATAQTGGQGSQAVENDLEVSGFIVKDDQGRDLSNRFSPDYPFHARSGQDVTVSGDVRFQNTAGHRPLQSDFAMIVNVSGAEEMIAVDGNGTFSGLVTLPEVDEHTLYPTIGRVGPVTGATGATDSTVSPPIVTIKVDDEAPHASPFLVSTSVGLLEANGFVWDPIKPLEVFITVADEQDRDEEVTLHYWREGIDDLNADGVAQTGEYQSMTAALNPLRSGSQQVRFSNIQIAANGFNGRVSLWISGTDWAGNTYQEGGTGGAPGVAADWATLQTAQNTETTLLNTGFSLDAYNGHLLAGQAHTISIVVQDANGVETLDDIAVFLAGMTEQPLGEFHYDPRQNVLTTVAGSHVVPISATTTVLSEDTTRIDLTFSMDWDTPRADQVYVPGLTVTDDTQTVANVNNLNDLAWQIDNILEAIATDLTDLTPPVSDGNASQLNVRQGDEIAIDGRVYYMATGIAVESPPENLSVLAQILYGSTVVDQIVAVQPGGGFSAALVLPSRAPLSPSMPIELSVINVPGAGDSVPNSDSMLVVDSDAPIVTFDTYRFPITSLTFLESDGLNSVRVDLIIVDEGGMGEGPLDVHWEFLRNGLPRLGVGGSSTLEFFTLEGSNHIYSSTLDMRPSDGLRLLEGDQVTIWFTGTDLAGNALEGQGTEGTPRVPTLAIIEFVPVNTGWTVTPSSPEIGEMVTIEALFANEGLRAGTMNISLVERIEGDWQIHDTVVVSLNPGSTQGLATFEWEAWRAGPADLSIFIDGDESNPIPVKAFTVTEPADDSALGGTTTLLIAVVGILALAVVGLLLVILMRRPTESYDDEFDEDWDDESTYGGPSGIRLDHEDSTLWNTVARHGIHDKEAFLEHAQSYDRDGDGFLDAVELGRAAVDFLALIAQPTVSAAAQYPLDYNDETVAHVIASHGILDASSFLAFAATYDEDANGYLNHSEISRAAADFVASGRNVPAPAPTAPDPRALAIGEVLAALPTWEESTVSSWLDKGWTAAQIIAEYGTPVAPPAPSGFGDSFVSEPVPEPELEPEPEPEIVEVIIETAGEPLPSQAALKRMKKGELVDLASDRGVDSTGTKSDIIARLLG